MKFNQKTHTMQFPKDEILVIINSVKDLEKGKSVEGLRHIVKTYKKAKHSTKPSKLRPLISATGEKAYQRAIKEKGTQLDSLDEIIWNDLELPVVFNKNARRLSVDLAGTLNSSTPVLCELKYGTDTYHSNSPIYAAIELLIYYYLIQDNHELLDANNVFHGDKSFVWSHFNDNSILIVGANESYWKYWKDRYERQEIDAESWIVDLESWIRPLKIRFFSFADFDFRKQKGSKKKYIPSFVDKTDWTEEFTKKVQG